MYTPIAKSYFSGAGLLDWSMQQAGIKIIQSLELSPIACKTLRLNFNHKIVESDITDVTVLSQEKSDVIIGTYPCNKYSTGADIHGTRKGEDLFLHFFRHIALEQPEVYVVENVPGMKKYPVVMEAMTKLPGYYINIFCPLDAANWLPQKRERLILIGTKKPFFICDPQPAFRRVRLSEILEDAFDMEIPDYVLARLNGKYRDRPIISDPSNPYELAPTCVSHYHKDLSTRLVKDKKHPLGVRPYTVREYARLQGVPDSFQFAGTNAQAYQQIGNGVAIPVGLWTGRQVFNYFNQ
jgi:DNA (cytosine-5)-methyltransferase 1